MNESNENRRAVGLSRVAPGRYRATNARGGELDLGSGETADFTPVELLLAGLAGCSAIDVDLITARRAEPTQFEVSASGEKVRDEHGNRLVDLNVTFTVRFPAGPEGDAAREALPRSVTQTRDRLCTVGRTIAIATPVSYQAD